MFVTPSSIFSVSSVCLNITYALSEVNNLQRTIRITCSLVIFGVTNHLRYPRNHRLLRLSRQRRRLRGVDWTHTFMRLPLFTLSSNAD
ncbi:hypothetical protein BDP27DRAFT_1332913 [Rhodocollybia butyracea]|uniref:Uncharacterized protein n=1 Tax=Rhodocollybia butyracea TaxID=206335 RepID=A0A9P5U4M2_9AGAR|nr:hypothetical protein BDP27DRAFT_1332913 [Rhodocollybia butyracea]